jgi:CubicO group peptidase (beta-lactamase class C family)
MRRTPTADCSSQTLFATSVLIPTVTAPAAAAHAASVGRHDRDGCPPGGLGASPNSRLDKAIEDVRRQFGIPGAIVGLWMPGRGSYVRTTGFTDTATRRPLATDSYLPIGSKTKTFTVTALLELVDQYWIRLDDPISRHVHGVPNGHRITLRRLAEMRSGRAGRAVRVLRPSRLRHTLLPYGAEFPEPHPRGYTEKIERRGRRRDGLGTELGLGGRSDDLEPPGLRDRDRLPSLEAVVSRRG